MNSELVNIVKKICDDTGILPEEEYFEIAELIVKECINIIESYKIPCGNSPAGELSCEWTYDALKTIRDDIKEHFGVE